MKFVHVLFIIALLALLGDATSPRRLNSPNWNEQFQKIQQNIMAKLTGKNVEASSSTHKSYNQNEGKQIENAQQFVDTDNDDCMQCNVCWDQIKIDQLCFCDHLMVSKSASSSSNTSNGNNNDNEGKSKTETHAFCSGCLEEYTKAAHEMMPFTKNGLGLKCMALNCENPITWQEIRSFIPAESIRALENQCAELCVALSGLDIVERCPKCNCAVDMNGTTADEKMLFHCPGAECGYEMCRKCNEEWADEHNYLNCEQFAKQHNHQNETRLSEVVVHKCHKCNIQFIKDEGCNYVTCTRCNATHCYCCQMPDIDSTHFCGCVPKMACNDNPCKCSKSECGKCLLTKDVAELETLIMERIRKEIMENIEKKEKRKKAGRVKNIFDFYKKKGKRADVL